MSELRQYQIERLHRLDRIVSILGVVLLLATAVVLSVVWTIPKRGWLILAAPIGGYYLLDSIRLILYVHWKILRWPQVLAILAALLPVLTGIVSIYFFPSLYWSSWLWIGMVPFFLLYAALRWQFIDRRIRAEEEKSRLAPHPRDTSRRGNPP